MSTRTATSCFLALAIAISAKDASAQQPPAQPPPGGANPAPVALVSQARPANVGPTRLFLAPTARTPPRGKGTFGLTEIAFPWGEIGLTDRAGLRVFAIPPLGDLTSAGVVIEPKIQLYGGARLQAAVGVVQAFAGQGSPAEPATAS